MWIAQENIREQGVERNEELLPREAKVLPNSIPFTECKTQKKALNSNA